MTDSQSTVGGTTTPSDELRSLEEMETGALSSLKMSLHNPSAEHSDKLNEEVGYIILRAGFNFIAYVGAVLTTVKLSKLAFVL